MYIVYILHPTAIICRAITRCLAPWRDWGWTLGVVEAKTNMF